MNPIRRFFQRRRVERELAEEMASHFEEKVDELMEGGKSEAEARLLAGRQFGNVTLQREDSRQAWGWNGLEQVVRDLRFGGRVLKKNLIFSTTAVAVLALGIGMNTAMFSAVKAVLLSSLPYPEPDRLVQLWQVNTRGAKISASFPDFCDWRAQTRSMAYLATYDADPVTVSGGFAPRRTRMGVVSSGFFEALGRAALIGRTFGAGERKPGGTPTAVLGYALSQQLFGEAAAAVGKAVRLQGMAFTVIGVMPAGFDFPESAQAWIPQEFFGDTTSRSAHNYRVLGRLKPGVSVAQAQVDFGVIAARLGKAYADDKDMGIKVISLYDEIVGPVRPALLMLFGAVTFVLLIACLNISNLQLARATVRMRELALRKALGGTRGRLLRQLLTESILLSTLGGAAGFVLAIVGTFAIRHFAPDNIPRLDAIRVDGSVLAFTTALSVLAGLAFGVLPALAQSRTDVNQTLKDGGGRSTDGRGMKAWGNTLVIAQVGIAILLVTGASLLMKSYWKLAHVDSGLRSSGVFTADLSWPTEDGNTANGKEVARIAQALIAQTSSLPGVQAVALVHPLPVRDGGPDGDFEIAGRALPSDPHLNPNALYRLATARYFAAFGVPISRGRGFDTHDEHSAEQVAVVNESFARKFFPDGNVLGERIRFFGFDLQPKFMQIIGVVPDTRSSGLSRPADPEVFADYMQHGAFALDASLVVRGTRSDLRAIQGIVRSISPETPVTFQSMDDVVGGTISRERFQTALLGLFAGFALLLSAVGIYGLLSYTVTRRTSEMGIRMALGADRVTVMRMVLLEGGRMVALGLTLGLVAALMLARTLSSLLYGIKAYDAGSFFLSMLTFAGVAMLGCYLPAFRASRIDPNVALRHE